jgi:hypothetical protein
MNSIIDKSADDVIIIKELRHHGAKVYYPTEGFYIEARGGIWEISLMLIKDFATSILIALILDWVNYYYHHFFLFIL